MVMEATINKFNIIDTIRDMRKVREDIRKLRQLIKKESDLYSPVLTDYSLLPRIHEMFRKLSAKSNASSVDKRRMFIFIVQYLYAPRNLFGYKMPRGLRRKLAQLTGLKAESPISRGAFESVHYYQGYVQFREEVNSIFGVIWQRLESDGVIK